MAHLSNKAAYKSLPSSSLNNQAIKKMKKYKITLTKEEREELETISSTGNQRAQNVLHALILLACDEGPYQKERSINETISRVLNVNMRTIDRFKKQFVEEGLEAVMTRKPTSRVFSRKVDGDLEAQLIALSCSPVPEGYARWALKLLANKAIALDYVDSIAAEPLAGKGLVKVTETRKKQTPCWIASNSSTHPSIAAG